LAAILRNEYILLIKTVVVSISIIHMFNHQRPRVGD